MHDAVDIRLLGELAELEEASAVFAELWAEPGTANPLPSHLLRALALSGNYVAGAFAGGRLVGASVAWATPTPLELHSHATGVTAGARGCGAGIALKLHQREWALERGIGRISWTFDPLVQRNLRFNLLHLGAHATSYLDNVYGVMEDPLNRGNESDRLLVEWDVDAFVPRAGRALVELAGDRRRVALAVGRDDRPEASRTAPDSTEVTIAVPPDIEALRARDPELARAWRFAVREELGGRLKRGWRVAGLDCASRYVLVRQGA